MGVSVFSVALVTVKLMPTTPPHDPHQHHPRRPQSIVQRPQRALDAPPRPLASSSSRVSRDFRSKCRSSPAITRARSPSRVARARFRVARAAFPTTASSPAPRRASRARGRLGAAFCARFGVARRRRSLARAKSPPVGDIDVADGGFSSRKRNDDSHRRVASRRVARDRTARRSARRATARGATPRDGERARDRARRRRRGGATARDAEANDPKARHMTVKQRPRTGGRATAREDGAREANEEARARASGRAARSATIGSGLALALWWASSPRWWTATRDEGKPAVDARAAAYAFGTSTEAISGWSLRDVAEFLAMSDARWLGSTVEATEAVSRDDGRKRVARRADGFARFVATHHKTGTALMHDVFSTIANRSSPPYTFFDVRAFEDAELVVNEVTGKGLERAARRRFREADIVLDYHFGKSLPAFIEQNETTRLLQSMISVSNAREYRIVHVVRDPLDVLVSGLAYHARSPNDERWLSRARVAELSYAEFLKTASPKDAIAAEMSFSDDEIRMLALTYVQCERNRDTCLNLRLEAFERNFDRTLERALRFLRFPSQNITSMIQIASVHDVSKWSEDELRKNEHYTKRIDRRPYYEAAREDDDIWRTITALRRAMGYDATS
jgi:hypothetical protein